ncbi:hypothetical protein GY26_04810 [Gammaproteobacteria bacterium MFB021]|nr:hypothetical protein GY26_04810 [Gammaproteobacteria bacterium MFB021]
MIQYFLLESFSFFSVQLLQALVLLMPKLLLFLPGFILICVKLVPLLDVFFLAFLFNEFGNA